MSYKTKEKFYAWVKTNHGNRKIDHTPHPELGPFCSCALGLFVRHESSIQGKSLNGEQIRNVIGELGSVLPFDLYDALFGMDEFQTYGELKEYIAYDENWELGE